MAAKTKINDHGDCIFTEQDAIDLLYTNPEFDIGKLFFDNIDQYNDSLKELGIDLPVIKTAPDREPLVEFDNKNINTIIIATRHDSHSSIIIKSLKSGKNVFVEKPLCISESEYNLILKEYNKSRKKIWIGKITH